MALLAIHVLITIRFTPDGPDDPNGSVQGAARDPIAWPLELGETLIVYHPHAKRPPEVILTRELAQTPPRSSEDLGDSFSPDDSRQSPYFPFRTLADFEQTELFIKRDYVDSQINEQLDLWKRHAPGASVTLKNAREMHKYLQAAGIEDDLSQVVSRSLHARSAADRFNLKFEQTIIQVPYGHKKTTETRNYKVHFRPALDAVKHVLEDPALRKHLIRYPERRYVRKPGTDENMRVWTDVHTADDWWDLQVIKFRAYIVTRGLNTPLEQNGSSLYCC